MKRKFTRTYVKDNGIFVFDSQLDSKSTYNFHHLDELFEAERSHFWFEFRRKKICDFFVQNIPLKASVLEIGGGTGYVAEGLKKLGYEISMADIYINGLLYAKNRGITSLYQFDLYKPPFYESFDVICFFDVLEHLSDTQLALKAILQMLKPGGVIVLTVPAHQWLWCRDDEIAGHVKRYSRKNIEGIFSSLNLQSIYIKYFFLFLTPFLLCRRFLNRPTGNLVHETESANLKINSKVNSFFQVLLKCEELVKNFLPNRFGGSIIAAAKKPLSFK